MSDIIGNEFFIPIMLIGLFQTVTIVDSMTMKYFARKEDEEKVKKYNEYK